MAYSLNYSYNSTSQSYSVTGYSNITTSDNVVIPDTYDDGTNGEHPVTSIDSSAFTDCYSLTSITIPNSVTSISDQAFYNCGSLTSVTIGNSVKSIDYSAFENCSSLMSITIPDSVTSIGSSAFYNCSSLTSVTIGNSVKSIDSSAFMDCSRLTSITIGNSVTSIGTSAFENCSSLMSITIPDSVTSIGSSAFDGTAWYNNQPDGVVYAGKVLYKYKGTMPDNTQIEIIDGTKGIADYAFSYCRELTTITIPDSVISIGNSAFENCSGLTSITIPDSVISIGNSTFYNCSSLTQLILFPSTPPTLASKAIPNNVQSIYVQQSSKAAYQAAMNWNSFAQKIVSDNLYLSFIRFNQKNKDYINEKVKEVKNYIDNKINEPSSL